MATNAPMPFAPEMPQGITKALTQSAQGLAQLYMEVVQNDPSSPAAEAILQLQRSLAEVGRGIGMPTASPDSPALDGSLDPAMAAGPEPDMGGMPGEGMPPDMGGEFGPPPDTGPLPPGASIEDAAGATQDMMLDAARRRSVGG